MLNLTLLFLSVTSLNLLTKKLTKIKLYGIMKTTEMGFLDETCEREPFLPYCGEALFA